MKNLIVSIVMVISLLLGFPTLAQTAFQELPELIEADELGTALIYVPTHLSGHRDLSPGEKIVVPGVISVHMKIAGGNYMWIRGDVNTKYVANSRGEIVRRWDCGNPIDQVYYFPTKIRSLAFKTDPEHDGYTTIKSKDCFDDGKNVIIQKNNWWSVERIIVPSLFGLVGGLVGGYGFQKENEVVTQTITPGVKVQTGDGTFIYGPQKIKTNVHVEKKFNWTGAAIGAVSGIILGYLLNEFVF